MEMSELSAQQLEIVNSQEKVIMVIAGPGSGKTRILTHKVKKVLDDGISEDSILLLTFTNKAAKNMISRLEAMVGHKQAILGGTFHHVANKFLRRHAASLFGYRSNYSIIDKDDCIKLIRDIVKTDFGQHAKSLPKAEELYRIFSYCRNSNTRISDYLKVYQRRYSGQSLMINKVYDKYTERKKRSNVMDFDDLLVYFNKLLDDAAFREQFQRQFTHIFVDEFQDTNRLQFEIISKMHVAGNFLFVVGDDCQSIYSFRAAEIKNMLRFTDQFSSARIFYLTENYRSTPNIVSLVNEIIRINKNKFDKELLPVRPSLQPPRVLLFDDSKSEAERIADEIIKSINSGTKPEEICVLYRSNFQAAYVEMSLAKRGIKYVKLGGLRFFELAHIKDVVAFLKITNNMSDELAWSRLLKMFDGIGEKTAKRIFERVCNAEMPLSALKEISDQKLVPLQRMLFSAEETEDVAGRARIFYEQFYLAYLREKFVEDVEERISDLQQLLSILSSYSTVDEFLEDSMLDANLIDGEDIAGRVTLSTIHQAKGLEWDNVFIIGLSQGRFPSKHALGDSLKVEEERRLFYVACSRARNRLIITAPLSDNMDWRAARDMTISQFINELPKDKYEVEYIKGPAKITGDIFDDFVSADQLLQWQS